MNVVSIITINYNQPKTTIELLRSIKAFGGNNVEVILVDNAPQQNFEKEFKEAYPPLIYLYSHKNIGFAGGNNVGIKAANGDYVLLLNNDTEITEGFISAMLNEINSNNDIGLLSPLIKYFDDKEIIQYAGFTKMNYLTARNAAIGFKEKDNEQYNHVSTETGFCHGAAVMCRKSDIEKAGLMDERYFLYYEELDWCEKFKRTGKKIWFTGKATIYHKESMSVGKESIIKIYFMTRNRMLFIRRNTGLMNTILFTFYFTLVAFPKQIFHYMRESKWDLIKYSFKGLLWNFTHSKNSKSLGFKI